LIDAVAAMARSAIIGNGAEFVDQQGIARRCKPYA